MSARAGLALLIVLSATTPAGAQSWLIEPIAGVAYPGSTVAGVSVSRVGLGPLGFRISATRIGAIEDLNAGVEARAGLRLATPVSGGLQIRPYLSLDVGVEKRDGASADLVVRPAIGVQFKPDSVVGYLVETGWSWSPQQPNRWSVLAGIVITR